MSQGPSSHLRGQTQANLNPHTGLLTAPPTQDLGLLHVGGASAVSALHPPAQRTRSFVQELGWARGLSSQGCSHRPAAQWLPPAWAAVRVQAAVGRPPSWVSCGQLSHVYTHPPLLAFYNIYLWLHLVSCCEHVWAFSGCDVWASHGADFSCCGAEARGSWAVVAVAHGLFAPRHVGSSRTTG